MSALQNIRAVEERIASILTDEQLEARLETTLATLRSRRGFSGMMNAIDVAVRGVVRGKRGDLGNGWIG